MQNSLGMPETPTVAKATTASQVRYFLSRPLAGILVLGLMLGMLSFIVVPAWWHYDEPGHFEYAWLVAHSPHWPVQGQYDQGMRRDMAASMIQVGWYRIRNIKVHLDSNERIPIGVTQVGDQPGYYFLASLPLRLMSNANITVQYYAARFVSLLLYLLIIVVVWYAGGEILSDNYTLRWMTTVFVALLPAFVDTMVSVDNDVSAVLAASLFIWASLRLIQKGYSLRRILFLVASLIGCYLSKNTAWFAFLLTPLVLILALLRGRFAPAVWGVAVLILIGLAALAFEWGGPKDWYTEIAGNDPVRIQAKNAPLGEYAFQLDDSGASQPNGIVQIIPPDQVKLLRGKTATLGAWMWADHAAQAGPLFIQFLRGSGDIENSAPLATAVTTEPTFHAVSFDVPSDAVSAIVYVKQAQHDQSSKHVFFDGLTLAQGSLDGAPPQFTGSNGTQGTWAGQKFENLIRNASAEKGSIQTRSWLNGKAAGFLTRSGINLSLIAATAQDWRGSGWYYQSAIATLFRTFWASLAGDKAFLASAYVSYLLALLTIGALIGAAIRLWRRRKVVRWDLIFFLGLFLLMPWLLAIGRGNSDILQADPLSPWARYAYPAIFPTALLLCAGWLEWLEILPSAKNLTAETRRAVFLSVMAGISIFTIMNAIQVFHPEWWYGWVSLMLLLLFQYAIFHFVTRRGAQLIRS